MIRKLLFVTACALVGTAIANVMVPVIAQMWVASSEDAAPFVPTAEMNEGMKAYKTCIVAKAMDSDDGTADAASVAIAADSACDVEFERAKEVWGRGHSAAGRQQFYQDIDKSRLKMATLLVLNLRAERGM